MSRKTGDLSADGHREEARLIGNAHLAFDLDTLFDTSDQLGDLIVRRRARDERDAKAIAAVWHQQRHALQSIVDSLDRFLAHHDEAVRLDADRYRKAVAA